MRFIIPALVLAAPAQAHNSGMPHTHTADWAVPMALFLIVAAALVAQRRAVRARK